MIDLETKHDFLLVASRKFFWRLALVAVLGLLVVSARRVLLTIFLGILAAVGLRAVVDWVQRVCHLNERWAYRLVLFLSVATAALLAYWLGPRVLTQAHQLGKAVPEAFRSLQENLNQYEWGRDLSRILSNSVQPEQAANGIKGYASSVITGLTDVVAVIAIALFLASNPGMYRDGALKLFPERVRPKAAEISRDIEFVLRWWLFGQLIPMAVLGAVSMIGLKLLGVPLAFTLGLLTALMLFLPYVGSVAAYLPTVLLALTKGPDTALWVTVLYLAVHLGEGYVLTPMVQRRAVKLAPALTLAAQLLLFEFAGVLGLLAATPLAAVARALVQKLYLREPA